MNIILNNTQKHTIFNPNKVVRCFACAYNQLKSMLLVILAILRCALLSFGVFYLFWACRYTEQLWTIGTFINDNIYQM